MHSVIKVISVPILYKLHLIVIKEHFQMNESSFNSVLYRNNEKDPPHNPSSPNPGQLEKKLGMRPKAFIKPFEAPQRSVKIKI